MKWWQMIDDNFNVTCSVLSQNIDKFSVWPTHSNIYHPYTRRNPVDNSDSNGVHIYITNADNEFFCLQRMCPV